MPPLAATEAEPLLPPLQEVGLDVKPKVNTGGWDSEVVTVAIQPTASLTVIV